MQQQNITILQYLQTFKCTLIVVLKPSSDLHKLQTPGLQARSDLALSAHGSKQNVFDRQTLDNAKY